MNLKKQKPIAVDVLFKAYPMVPLSCRSKLAGPAVPLMHLSGIKDFSDAPTATGTLTFMYVVGKNTA